MSDVITLDIESTGLDFQRDKILLAGYTVNEKDFKQIEGSEDKNLKELLKDPSNILRGHGIRFDALFLSANGFDVSCTFEDTRVLAYLSWPEAPSHSLKALVRERLRTEPKELSDIKFKPLKRDKPYINQDDYYAFSDGDIARKDLLRDYHREDVLNTNRLYLHYTVSDWFREVEQPLTRILYEMQRYGAPLDGNVLRSLDERFSSRVLQLLTALRKETKKDDFNPNSPDQKRQALKDRGYKLEEICEKTKGGEWSVDAPLLKSLAWKGDKFAETLLEYSKLSKLLSTYVGPLAVGSLFDGRIHGAINQAGSEDADGDGSQGTKTGRLASSEPNLQNIPSRTKEGREVRRAFIASGPDWHMFDCDLPQIEPRLVAHYSQAPKLIHAYANNLDTHGMFAKDIFGKEVGKDSIERFIGKTSWLATVYGCSYKKLLEICERNSDEPLSMDTTPYKAAFDYLDTGLKKRVIKECGTDYRRIYEQWMFFKDVQKRFEATNPEIFEWRQTHINRTKRLGYVITLGGRRIQIDGLASNDFGTRLRAERKAINYTIQGSAADLAKQIMIEIHKQIILTGKGRMFAVVHDEFLGELRDPADKSIIDRIITNVCALRNVTVPGETKILDNWSQK